MRPSGPPIGLHLAQVARTVSRAFDEALAEAGGTLPTWLVLVNVKAHPSASQRELAEAIGVTEATLTHHLNRMDTDGLVTRRRDPANRRVHLLELTESGEAAFVALREAATGFDRRLRRGLTDGEVEGLALGLNRLAANVDGDHGRGPEWSGLLEGRR